MSWNDFQYWRGIIGDEEAARLYLKKDKNTPKIGGRVQTLPAGLFDQPEPPVQATEHPRRTVSPNSVESFYNPVTQLKRGTQKERLFEAIKILGTCTQAELKEATGIPRHLIPDRLISLENAGLIQKAGSKIDPYTGIRVTTYSILTQKRN